MNSEGNNEGIHDAPKVIGLPGINGSSDFVQQNYQDTCAVRSQELILRDFGVQVSEDALRNEAFSKGWYTPGSGTDVDKVGNLLESHGVHVNRYENANIFTLTNELAQGHKVIIGVDSGELWNKGLMEDFEDKLGIQGADHALIVSGIDTSDPDHVKVVLTDPGTGDVAREYPMDQFIDAWKDSNCFMVSTAQPAPAWLPEMANFDYHLGHIESIGNLPYDEFQTHYSTAENHDGNIDSDSMGNPVEDFLQAVAGENTLSSFFPTHGELPTHSWQTPAFPDIVPGEHEQLHDVDHGGHHEPTIADLIQQHTTNLDPNEHFSKEGSDNHTDDHTGFDEIFRHA